MFGFNPYVIVGLLIVYGLTAIGSFAEGIHYAHLEETQTIIKVQAKAIEQTKAEDKITLDTSVKEAQQQRTIQYVTLTTEKYIPVYVTKKSVNRCVVPSGFVQLLNDRARDPNVVPVAGGQSVDTPAGIGLDTVAGVVSANYGRYGEIAAELTALQQWVRQINAASQAK